MKSSCSNCGGDQQSVNWIKNCCIKKWFLHSWFPVSEAAAAVYICDHWARMAFLKVLAWSLTVSTTCCWIGKNKREPNCATTRARKMLRLPNANGSNPWFWGFHRFQCNMVFFLKWHMSQMKMVRAEMILCQLHMKNVVMKCEAGANRTDDILSRHIPILWRHHPSTRSKWQWAHITAHI